MRKNLTKIDLIAMVYKAEKEKNELSELYLTANKLIQDSLSYISYLLLSRQELENKLLSLQTQQLIPFDVKAEMQKIKDELRELENQNDKGI